MNPQLPLSLVPASRSTDSMGSVDAEERRRSNGKLAESQRRVLAAFCRYPGYTTKELALATGMDRVEVGRRAGELSPVYLTRIEAPPGTPKGQRELRWNPTEAGKRIVERMA